MAVETLIHYRCDRCGKEERVPANVGEAPDRPKAWGLWQYIEPGKTVPSRQVAACPDCLAEVNNVIGRKLIHVGHARQSGSGKTWTELGLERQSDPERWFQVFAFRSGPDLPPGIETQLRSDLAHAKAERDDLRRRVNAYQDAAREAQRRRVEAQAEITRADEVAS